MEEGRVGAYGERKIRVCPQRRPRNASGHRARRNQRPKGWRHWIASWRFQPKPLREVVTRVQKQGGAIVGSCRDPLGGSPLAIAVLPVDSIEPTPFQRDLSEAHHKKLAGVIEKTGTYLDPIISVPAPNGGVLTAHRRHPLLGLRRGGGQNTTTFI